jgi:uncharacterized membrane protein
LRKLYILLRKIFAKLPDLCISLRSATGCHSSPRPEPRGFLAGNIEKTKKEFKETSVTLILGGFGLVAALAWNEAIKSLVETFFQKNSELMGKFIYAIIVTVVVVIISARLKKILEKTDEKEQ